MSSQRKKSTKRKRTPNQGSRQKPVLLKGKWIAPILFGVLGGIVFFYLQPILSFNPDLSSGSIALLTTASSALAVFGTTSIFKKHIERITYIGIGFVVLHTVVNILLTYGWLGQHPLALFLASSLGIPIAIVWFFILKYQTEAGSGESLNGDYAFTDVFKPTTAKIFGVAILLISTGLIFYRLGYFDIWEDENLVINAAVGVSEQGYSYFEEGYSRARLHTMLIAGLFEIFGPSEFIGRIPSAVFGVCFVLICFYVFSRWYGITWLVLFLPLICLMNDRFLLLFRYMRMYALLIPLFLAGTYILIRTIEVFQRLPAAETSRKGRLKKWGYVLLSLLFLLLLAHMHKLSMILLPVFGFYIIYQVLLHPTKARMGILYVISSGVVLLLFLTFVVQIESFKMFRQVADRIFSPHNPMTAYFEYVFNNGLPRNVTIMFLIAGLGLLFSKLSNRLKSLLVINYLLIIIAVVSMVYLIGNSGRDYRYIAHIVPFVVCTLLFVIYYAGKAMRKHIYPWGIITVFLISVIHFQQDYKRDYDKHPWAPKYSVVYNTLTTNFKPGDALIVQNVKTYYLDPVALAGDHLLKVSKQGDYTLKQFKEDIRREGHGWVMWEFHKSHHLSFEIRKFIYSRFKPYHNANLDDLGVELFYFDETMVGPGQK